jgi:uncharacterized protein (TIGR03066 family)
MLFLACLASTLAAPIPAVEKPNDDAAIVGIWEFLRANEKTPAGVRLQYEFDKDGTFIASQAFRSGPLTPSSRGKFVLAEKQLTLTSENERQQKQTGRVLELTDKVLKLRMDDGRELTFERVK